MALPSDDDIRAAIKAVIVGAAPIAVVAGRWILKFEQAQWPGLLKSTADNGRTHGYVITRIRNGPGNVVGIGRRKRFWRYSIMGIHYYDTGTDAANSEKLFKAEIDAITAAFDAGPVAGTRQVQEELIDWQEDLKPYGTEFCHVAMATLVVEPCG